MSIDVLIVAVAYFLALSFRFEGVIPGESAFLSDFGLFVLLAISAHIVANWFSGAYTIINRYIGLIQALRIVRAAVYGTSVLFLMVVVLPTPAHLVPLTVVVVGGFMSMVFMVAVRFYTRIFYERSLSNVAWEQQLLVVGAGPTAEHLIREIGQTPELRTRVVGIVNDDRYLQGMRLHQAQVLGTIDQIPEIVSRLDVTEVLVADPEASGDDLARIHKLTSPLGIPVKTLPTLSEMMNGEVHFKDARELRIEDVLGREKVDIDLQAIGAYLHGKKVLVTGAAGSIGSELCRQIAAFGVKELFLIDKDESALYHLHEELRERGYTNYTINPTSVALPLKMDAVFAAYRPQIVFHAAAFKHVPLMELHPDEAVINNVKGTLVIAETAARYGAERVVNISTDKAVDPVNVMGATKRIGEQILRLLAERHPHTHFCSVRFGNVLGSRGSVIPLFRQQIEAGGPVTITDPAMTRYFMTIEEAVRLVLQAGSMADEVRQTHDCRYGAFVLDMGSPVRIMDLATQMIELLAPKLGKVDIEVTGLRPGEKLHEELYCEGESALPTSHPSVNLALLAGGNGSNPSSVPKGFEENLHELIHLGERFPRREEMLHAIQLCVPSYQPFDWTQVGTFPGVDHCGGELSTSENRVARPSYSIGAAQTG